MCSVGPQAVYRTRTHGPAVFAYRIGPHLSATVRRPVEELRQRRAGGAYVRGGGPHRPRAVAHPLSGEPAREDDVPERVVRGRPGHEPGRRRRRRHRNRNRNRRSRLRRIESDRVRDGRCRTDLCVDDERADEYRRRRRHGAARRLSGAGHRDVAVPSDRHRRRGRARHRRLPRRRRLSDQQGRRALHGALCADRKRPRGTRRRCAFDDSRNSRRSRLWSERRLRAAETRSSRAKRC